MTSRRAFLVGAGGLALGLRGGVAGPQGLAPPRANGGIDVQPARLLGNAAADVARDAFGQ